MKRCDKLSGVVRGECRGGLGGAAAPNRPPSAARAQAAQTKIKKSPRARRAHKPPLKRQALLYCSYANPNEPFPNNNPHFCDSIQPTRRSPPFHPALYRPLALRGAQGDRRAQRGSSRSRSRAALVECRKRESPSGVLRGGCKGGREGGAAP